MSTRRSDDPVCYYFMIEGFELLAKKASSFERERKVKRNDPNWVRYNAGSVKFYAKGEVYKGLGVLGIGLGWETVASFSQNLYAWGAWGESRSWVLARCDASSFVELPMNFFSLPPWRASVGDVSAVLNSVGNLVIRITVDGREELLWTSHTPSPFMSPHLAVIPIGIFIVFAITDFLTILELPDGKVCKYGMSSRDYCLEPDGTTYTFSESRFRPDEVIEGPGQTRWRLYADGNMKLEYTVVQSVGVTAPFGKVKSHYRRVWKTAWESGVHGSCALKKR